MPYLLFGTSYGSFLRSKRPAWTAATLFRHLKQAGEEIWGVGIDDTYSSMKHQNDEALGNAFDIIWLTVVCIKLKEIKAGKTPRVRATGHG